MSTDHYQRYKDVLRRGHVAVMRGRLDVALVAYEEASRLAPDRALPHVSLGGVHLQLGAPDRALDAYDAALGRAVRDETALLGRAESLIRLGRRVEAAETLDVLSEVQDATGRLADACDSARRALELAEQKARRRHVQDLTRRLGKTVGDQAAEQALARALRMLELGEPPMPAPAQRGVADPSAAGGFGAAHELGAAAPRGVAASDAGPGDEDADAGRGANADSPEADGTPPDGLELLSRAEVALDARDPETARIAYLAAARALAGEGLLVAALDACYLALAIAPDHPDHHLALVELYLELGWTGHAAEKLALLGRLIELDGNIGAHARLCELISANFPDDPTLTRLCA
jgi:tetratricopeptide (TPR) repeat protein